MRRFLKRYFNFHHYLAFLRKQPAHRQHMYAATFAASITAILAIGILYFDYGFWRERYNRTDVAEVVTAKSSNDQLITIESPGEIIGNFFKEASIKVKAINTDGASLLQGKEEFKRENTQ